MSATGSTGSTTDQVSETASQVAEQAQQKVSQVQDMASGLTGQATEKAGQVKEQATAKADQGLDMASGSLSTAADKLREQAQGDGPVPPQAAMVADRLDQVSAYFKDKDTNQIVSDLETFVRSKPVESVIGAVAIGFVLAKIVR